MIAITTNNSIKLNKNLTKDFTIIAESGIKEAKDIKKFNDQTSKAIKDKLNN